MTLPLPDVETLQESQAELKNRFLALLSHELKHPLNLISVNAQLLLALPEAQALPAVLRAARTIERTVQGQARVIDDLLDLSRSNAGALALERVPLLLGAAIEPCLLWARSEAERKGVRFDISGFDEPIRIDADPARVQQIAWNLLSNAIKFCRSGGRVAVRLSRGADEAVLEVGDTGRGISPEFLPSVFEAFEQAGAPTTRGEGGLGVGLALVRRLVELHGGRVLAESEGRGRGATFRVWLPLHRNEGSAPCDAAEPAPAPALAGLRILLVDDTPDTLETFAYLLEHEGAQVEAASSGREALQLAETRDFDLMISDVAMPQMDGYEMMTELRTRPRVAALPAIALTGCGRPRDVRRALEAGFDAHVDKPVDMARIRGVIRDVLSEAHGTPDRVSGSTKSSG